jgi:hypothetical protein
LFDAARAAQEGEPQTPQSGSEKPLLNPPGNHKPQPRRIGFAPDWTPLEATEHILAVRFAEALAQSVALDDEDDNAHHAFRLACKRLRYAVERNDPELLGLEATAQWLSEMTDALGEAHDAVVLRQEAAEVAALEAAAALRKMRDEAVQRARDLWRAAFAPGGPANHLTHLICTAPPQTVLED